MNPPADRPRGHAGARARCELPDDCRVMMVGTVAEMVEACEDRLRREIDQRIAEVRRDMDAVADRAATKAIGGVMKLLFKTETPEPEQITTFREGQSFLRWGKQMALAALLGGLIAVGAVMLSNTGHQALDVFDGRMGIAPPVVGQTPQGGNR